MRVAFSSTGIIEQHGGAVTAGEILFQGQDLAAITQRCLRQQTQLGTRIKRDPLWFSSLHRVEQKLGGFGEFDFRGMEQSAFGFGGDPGIKGG
jgi:hypothetical protein